MEPFSELNLQFFTRLPIFPASIGTFRYRFARDGWMNDGTIHAWVYENIAFELAQNKEQADFPWTEEGIEQLKSWLREKLAERGSEPYRIPYP